jgi:ATP-dependent DNA helicase RecQ
MNQSHILLKKYWGYEAFRPLQEQIIDAAIYGKDVFALLPTGGGKSICYQIPGIAREGICLVISPLIALMQDQIDQLVKRGIRATSISSTMSYREIDIVLDQAKFGAFDFLYTSPERLNSRLFLERFKQMNVGLIVIDEAHCISEWGHDFRPSYRQIADLRLIHPEVPLMATTATATPEVKEDIIQQLALRKVAFFEASFQRKNISYEVYHVESKEDAILKWVNRFPKMSGIIYCQTRKSVKEVAQFLHQQGIQAGIYHGGLDSKIRKTMMEQWMSDQTPIMVATNAFGMGIDKPSVRYVIHYEYPNNLEAYFQEAGRAGRDGKESRTIVFVDSKDLSRNENLIQLQFPTIETIKATYRALCNYLHIAIGSGKNEGYPIDLKLFCSNFRLDLLPTFQSLKLLEMNGDIHFNETMYTSTKVKFAVGNTVLYSFQIKHEKYAKLIEFLTRSYPGIFDMFFEINEEIIQQKLGFSEKQLDAALQFLEENGIIDISWKSNLPTLTFLHERLPDQYLRLTDEVYNDRKTRAIKRWESVKKYLYNKTCREQFLLNYFGQEVEECGKCDYCKEKNKTKKSLKELQNSILHLLKDTPKNNNQLIKILDNEGEESIKSALHVLLMNEKIEFKDGLYWLL